MKVGEEGKGWGEKERRNILSVNSYVRPAFKDVIED